MIPDELYEMMKKVQEPKGYFFNKDMDWALSILSDLLVNKDTIRLYVLSLPSGGRQPRKGC